MSLLALEHALAASPAEKREAAIAAVRSVCGEPQSARPVLGGTSGATILKIESARSQLLLRVEGPDHPMLRRNPHRFAAERAAAAAGIAPAVHLIDERHGVVISDFVQRRPIASFPGGPSGLAQGAGALLARLHALPPFPSLIDYADLVEGMLKRVAASALFTPGGLEPHLERLVHVRAVLAQPADRVAGHNDPNPRNILFDGERLWLIDWESAYGNLPTFDAAIMIDNLADTPELEAAFIQGWRGGTLAPDEAKRLTASKALERLYYACVVLQIASMAPTLTPQGLGAKSPGAIQAEIAAGRLAPMTPQCAFELGQMLLAAFLANEPFRGIGATMAMAMFGPSRGLDGL